MNDKSQKLGLELSLLQKKLNFYQWLYSQKSVNLDVSPKYFPSKWGLLQGLSKANL